MVRGSAFLVVAAVSACACGGPPGDASLPGERTASTSSAIQGGQADTTHTFVVGILADYGGDATGLCTGTLLAPNLAVTARHCVALPADTTIDCKSSTFGAQVTASKVWVVNAPTVDQTNPDPTTLVPVAQIITPQAQTICGNDIALLVLGQSIQLDVYAEPSINPPMTDHNAYSTTITEIGYGLDSATDDNSGGVRRIREDVGLVCIPNDSSFNDCFSDPAVKSVMSANEFQSGDGGCEGDSGSSAFDSKAESAGKWISFGVLSRGATEGSTCSTSVYTRFDAWGSLLVGAAKTAAAEGGYAVPAWTSVPVAVDSPTPPTAAGSGCAMAAKAPSSSRSAGPALALAGLMAVALGLGRRRRRAGHLSGRRQLQPPGNP